MRTHNNLFSWSALRIYLIAIMFYSISYTLMITIPFQVASWGATNTDIGLIMGVSMFASMFLRPLAGAMIDKFGKELFFLGALVLFAVSLFGYFVPSMFMFGAVRLCYGLVSAFFSTAMGLLVIELFTESERGQGLSLYSLSTMIPATFCPTLALFLKDRMEISTIIWMLVVVACVNLWLGSTLYRRSRTERSTKPAVTRQKGAWKNRVLILSSLTMMFASTVNGAIFTFLPLYLTEQQSPYASRYFLVQMILLVICRFFGRRHIQGKERAPKAMILTMTLLLAIGSFLIGSSLSLVTLMGAAVCNGIAFAMIFPTLMTFVSFNVPEHSRGFLLGVFSGVDDFGFAMGSLVMGVLVDTFNYSVMYLTCAGFALLACFLFSLFRSKQLTSQPTVNL